MSTTGIALDLDIRVETVMTYRKRSYRRLGIATQRELLLWYIKLWTHVGGPDLKRHSSEMEKIRPASNQNELAWQL